MSHQIYHTEGLVLSSRNVGEANRFLTILTRELGIVRAQAQSVRTLRSRLRYSLQDFSYARVDMVRGRDIWRVTSASKMELLDGALRDRHKRMLLGRVFRLLERLYLGEEPNEPLFRAVLDFASFLEREQLSAEERKQAEILAVIRMLSALGYWEGEDGGLECGPLSKDLARSMAGQERALVRRINRALRETHL